MSYIHDTGLTQVYGGTGTNGEPPVANIVFIHGLNGHPYNTWTAKNTSPTSPEPDPTETAPPSVRKGSKFNILKRAGTGFPLGRTTSVTQSTFSSDSGSDAVSPGESVDHLTAEPEGLPSPPIPSSQSSKKKVFWPQDILPIDFPNTRIYTFGYDAKLVKPSGNSTVSTMGTKTKLSFSGHAHDLMVTLNKELDDRTPIILCAHSLGGVLAKRALWVSHIDDHPDLQKLAKLTKVIMFFGTPHHGSNKANVAEIATAITQLAGRESRQNLATSLRLDSEILDNIHTDFLRLLRRGQFYIHNFIEGRPIIGIGKIVADYSSTIADSSGMQMHEVIDGDHRSMNRYGSAQDAGYRKVVSALHHYMKKLDRKHDIERRSIASHLSIPVKTYYSVPHERNELFVGREDCIGTINKYFSGPKYTSFVSLYGLGGIGKTQVAIEFANRWRQINDTESIFWVHANDVNNFDASLATILEDLKIPPSAETNPRSVVEEWLRNKSNGRWLLIIDNVDDRSVLDEKRGKGKFKMLSCIPKVEHGHVLFTTRYKRIALDLPNDVVRLDHMPDFEALELLQQSMGEQYDNSQVSDAEILLKELSYIPLAIAHAGAYIRRSDGTIARYLELFQESDENRMRMLEKDIEGMEIEEADSDDPKTVLKTSWLSFKRLKTDREAGRLATELLALMSFLDRQEIPRVLLQSFRPKAGSLSFSDALDTLKVYSLITENTVSNTCAMHRLVQLSMRRWLDESEEGEKVKISGEDALKLLSDNFPDGSFGTWDQCKVLVVHADTVLSHTEESENRSGRSKLLQNCANYQDGKGQYSVAETKFEEVVKLRTELVGADNTETLRAMDQLAWALRNQAKKTEALELATRTLKKKENLFGKTSAEALTTSHIVATITGDQGKHQDAAKIHQANFEARKELLDPKHLDTLRSASALSLELWELGKFVDAESLARETLASRTELLGERHPDTLEVQGTLGFILEIQGKYAEALEVKEKMLAIREEIYGEDHPDTADSCHDMGWIHHQMGDYGAADPLYIRSLKAKRRLLGETHPKTLTTMCNLPVFYCDKGEYEEAEKRSKSLIAVFKQVQGDQHPQTLDATGGLAVILRHLGKLDEAAKAARTSIDGRNIVLGPDHPWTLPPLSHWGYILTLQGSTTQGEEVIRGALASLEKAMGPESSNVLTSLVFLSKNLLLQATGPEDAKLEESEQLAKRALESRKKLLGEKHPYTYKTMHHLSRVVLARGRHEEAKSLCKEALAGLRETLGLGHPDTMKCDVDLRELRKKFGDDGEEEGVVDEGVIEVEIV